MERAMGIEPTSEAWEAYLKARKSTNWRQFCVSRCASNGFQLEQRAVTPNGALILTRTELLVCRVPGHVLFGPIHLYGNRVYQALTTDVKSLLSKCLTWMAHFFFCLHRNAIY